MYQPYNLPYSGISGSLKNVFEVTSAWENENDWIPVVIDPEGENVLRIYTCVVIMNIYPCF